MATCRMMHRKRVRAQIRGKLLERRYQLLNKLTMEGAMAENQARLHVTDEAEQSTESLNEDINLRALEIRSAEAQQVDEALERVSEGTYGLCGHCGKRIPAARLQLLPEATLCVQCQKRLEREQSPEEAEELWAGGSGGTSSEDSAPARTIRATTGSRL